jgi:hypothetical protein
MTDPLPDEDMMTTAQDRCRYCGVVLTDANRDAYCDAAPLREDRRPDGTGTWRHNHWSARDR